MGRIEWDRLNLVTKIQQHSDKHHDFYRCSSIAAQASSAPSRLSTSLALVLPHSLLFSIFRLPFLLSHLLDDEGREWIMRYSSIYSLCNIINARATELPGRQGDKLLGRQGDLFVLWRRLNLQNKPR
ncbi:hypothetical protein Dimus_005457 [Dionaea muscipula]